LTERSRSPDSPSGFEIAFSELPSAVTLVTIADERDDVGVTVSAFCPVSVQPPLISICLIGDSYPAELLGRLDRFAVTVLASGQRMLAGRFAASGRPGARHLLADVPYHRGELSGALIPGGGLLALECQVSQRVPAGDHLLILADVLAVTPSAAAADPLIRFRGRYPALVP
jgi:flavin reductase (DIM6/NTAB) family NADH-FMN oxidoreductase RutF